MHRFIVRIIIIIIITVLCLVKMLLRIDPAYVRFVGYNLKLSLNSCLQNRVSEMTWYSYNLYPYQFHISGSSGSLVTAIRPK